ncbi:MAG: Cof-type HAD-IIB family hydrolase [Chloroflexota bacterium]
MTIKLLALDLDGTLFGDDLIISDRIRAAIMAAQQKGVIVTIATGRMFRSARHVAAKLSLDEPLICYQGALIQHSISREVLYHKTVPIHLAHEIISATADRSLHLNMYVGDELYVAADNPQARYYADINMDLQLHIVDDLHLWLEAHPGAEPTKLVIVTDAIYTDDTLNLFTDLYGDKLQVTKSHPRFTEFTSKECSKGHALSFLSAHYGIDQAEVMAIGDGHNDLDMIAWAGYGVAMSTAPQAVLDVARIISPPISEDGAAFAIEKYVLGL